MIDEFIEWWQEADTKKKNLLLALASLFVSVNLLALNSVVPKDWGVFCVANSLVFFAVSFYYGINNPRD